MTGCIDGNVAGRTRTMGITMFVCPLTFDIFMNNGWDKNIEEHVGHQIVGDLSKYNIIFFKAQCPRSIVILQPEIIHF